MRLPKLAHVKFVRTKGKVYAYFDTGKDSAALVSSPASAALNVARGAAL